MISFDKEFVWSWLQLLVKSLQNNNNIYWICKGKGHIAKFSNGKGHIAIFCRDQEGTETYVNDVNRINNKPFCRTILKIAVGGPENIRKSFHNRFVCLI